MSNRLFKKSYVNVNIEAKAKKVPGRAHEWDAEQKMYAAQLYIVTANTDEVARQTGIPKRTIQRWISDPAFQDSYMNTARRSMSAKLEVVQTKLIETAYKRLEERLDEGDAYAKKDGSLGYKPVSARDCAVIAAVTLDKVRLARGEPTSISRSESTKKLTGLKEELEQAAEAVMNKNTPTAINNSDESINADVPEPLEHYKK